MNNSFGTLFSCFDLEYNSINNAIILISSISVCPTSSFFFFLMDNTSNLRQDFLTEQKWEKREAGNAE